MIRIEPMTTEHIDEVLKIEEVASPEPWTRGIFTDELSSNQRAYYVAVAGSRVEGPRVVGFAGLLMQVTDGHVANIAVDPLHRRRRIAARLLLALCRAGVARGARALTLEVRVSNHGARELYRRFGFAPAGVRPQYYANNGEDALIMWAHDVDTAEFGTRMAEIAQWIDQARVDQARVDPARVDPARVEQRGSAS